MKRSRIAVVLAVGLSAVVAADTMAQEPLDTCEEQQSKEANAVVVTPTPTPTRTRARRAQPRTLARGSQVTANESGLPRAVDSQGEPIAGAVELTFTFGSGREPITRRQAFLIPEDMSPGAVTTTVPFQDVTDEDGRPLPDSHLRAVVEHTGPGRVVTLSVCLDPDTPQEMRAGTYTGTALVGVADRVTPVALRATVQDDRWLLIVAFALAGVIGGLFVRLFADKQSTDHIKQMRHVSTPRVITTVVAGLIVAFYSIRTIYLDDPTFFAGAGDLWRITAETFAGTLAAKTISDLAGRQRPEEATSPAQPAATQSAAPATT
jgi:hypothetical protein